MSGELIGHCGVDSGQILLTDPCYIESHWDGTEGGRFETVTYSEVCEVTLDEKRGGECPTFPGVAVSTMWGDGVYPVYAERDAAGRIRSVTIVFDDEDEDEGEDFSCWDCEAGPDDDCVCDQPD